MIDAVAILVSCFVLALVVIRAIRLDSSLPWFAPLGVVKPVQTTQKNDTTRVTDNGMLSDKRADND